MIRFIEVNGVITIRRVSNKLTPAQHADNWLANRKEIERRRANKKVRNARRVSLRELNKVNRNANARKARAA